MRRFLAAALAFALAGCGGDEGGGAASARTLHVFVWSDYLVPELVSEFEREANCRVAVSHFQNNDELVAKLLAGVSGYDLVCPTDYVVPVLVKAGAVEPIDRSRLPNLANLAPRFRDPPWDPGLRHSVPYQWGVTGIAYRRSDLKDPPSSWKHFFDDAFLAAWSGRISLLNDMREVVAMALIASGRSPNSRDPKDLDAAAPLLAKLKPHVAKYDSDDYGASLVAKEIAVAQGWSGAVAGAQSEDADIAFVVPSDGTLAYVDNWAIAKGAPSPDLAHAFMDFLLRADVAARAANERRYASVNEAARAQIDPAVLSGTAYAGSEPGANLIWLEDAGDAGDLYKRLWSSLKD